MSNLLSRRTRLGQYFNEATRASAMSSRCVSISRRRSGSLRRQKQCKTISPRTSSRDGGTGGGRQSSLFVRSDWRCILTCIFHIPLYYMSSMFSMATLLRTPIQFTPNHSFTPVLFEIYPNNVYIGTSSIGLKEPHRTS